MRHMLDCSRGFVLSALVTAGNVHDTWTAGWLFDRAPHGMQCIPSPRTSGRSRPVHEAPHRPHARIVIHRFLTDPL